MKTESQESQIREFLESGRSLTQVEALVKFGSFRLSARINRLKNKGMNIGTEMVETTTGKRVARYRLI